MSNDLDTFKSIARALAPFLGGSDLLDATEAVMAVSPMQSLPHYTISPSGQRVYVHDDLVVLARNNSEVMDFMRSGKKIHAIKVLRQQTLCGLKQAKEAVEDSRVQGF